MKLDLEGLKRIKEDYKERSQLKERGKRAKIIVHMGTCGIAAGAKDIMAKIEERIKEMGITDVIVTKSGCAGMCCKEPMITIEVLGKPPVKYGNLSSEKIERIFLSDVISGNILSDLAIGIGYERTY